MFHLKNKGGLEKLAQWYQKVRYECIHNKRQSPSTGGGAGEEPWLFLPRLEQADREALNRTELVD